MKNSRQTPAEEIIFWLSIILATGFPIINASTKVPDFIKGFIIGLIIAIAFGGIVLTVRKRRLCR